MRCASICRVRKLSSNRAICVASHRDYALVQGGRYPEEGSQVAPRRVPVHRGEGGAARPDGQGVSRVRGGLLLLDGCEYRHNCIVPVSNEVGNQRGRYRADDVTKTLNATKLQQTQSYEGVLVCYRLYEV